MYKLLLAIVFFIPNFVLAVQCDCEIRVFHPIHASHSLKSTSLKTYSLESFDNSSRKNQLQCRESCFAKFQSDMSEERMIALLSIESQKLIEQKVVGYNCTGLTTFKYPVRVKASLGNIGLGNVIDQMYVLGHEQVCF